MVTSRVSAEMDINGSEILPDEVQLRPINCELNPLSRSDAAALFAQGGTCVLASLLGPVEAKSQLKIDQAFVECNFRPKEGVPTIEDKLRECIIRDACEAAILTKLHPRTLISVQVQELDDRCGLQACAINAACMALLIGAVPMKYTFAAVQCIIDKDNKILVDPDSCQAIGCSASFTFVFDSVEKNIVTVSTHGSFKMAQFITAELLCRTASEIIFNFYRKLLFNFHNKSLVPVNADEAVDHKKSKSEKEANTEPMEA